MHVHRTFHIFYAMQQVRDSLILAALTTLSVAFTSLLAFTDTTRAFLTPSVATLACSFPITFALLRPGILLSEVAKTIVGCMLGWGLGAMLYSFSTLVPASVASRPIISTIVSFPIVCGLVLADPICRSPMSAFISPSVAIITMYVMSSFARDLAYVAGLYMLIAYVVSSVITLIVFLSIRPVLDTGSTKHALKESLTEFQSSMTHWFEGLTAFMLSSSGQHEAELDARQKKATDALSAVQAAIKLGMEQDPIGTFKDPSAAEKSSVTMVVMHSQLLAFRGTIFKEGYSESSIKTILGPVRDLLDKLRMTTVLALRPTSPEVIRAEATGRISQEALLLYNDFARAVSFTASTSSTTHSALPATKEEIRLVFAITSVVRFATLAQHMLSGAETAFELLPPLQSLSRYLRTQFGLLFSKAAWKKTTNYKYAFRSALAQQVFTQILLLLAKSYPTRITPYMFWALIPVVSNFLNTVGAGLTQGVRNIAGCLGGAVLGVLTALANAGNREAIYLEMLIVAFCSKFVSNYRSLTVAAITFASTWNVLSIPNVHIEELKVLLSLVGYRISLTVLGVFACAVLSILLFPSFAAGILRKSIARTVTTAASLVSEGIIGVIERMPISRTTSFDEERYVCSSNFSPSDTVSVFEGAVSKALESIRKHTSMIPSACEEARPELVLIEKFDSADPETELVARSLASLIGSEELIQRLSDAACVFSSIAASTRVHESCHSVVFTKEFIVSLQHLLDILAGAAARIAAYVMDSKSTLRVDSRLNSYIQDVTKELFHIRDSLERSGMLEAADRGGWLQIYVFHFALVEFTAAWDDLATHLSKRRRDSKESLASHSLEDSFNSPSQTTLSVEQLHKSSVLRTISINN